MVSLAACEQKQGMLLRIRNPGCGCVEIEESFHAGHSPTTQEAHFFNI